MLHLRNASCSLSVAPERGAIVTSLEVQGRQLLYLDQATFDDPEKNVRGGIPVLFPICGPLAGPDYEWDGQRYTMKQHGFARNLAWNVLEGVESRALLELRDDPTTRAQYPFGFSYQLELTLLDDGVRIGQTMHNRDDQPMPAQFGFHPYFLVGDKSRLQLDLPVTEYSDNKSDASGPFPGFDFTRPEIDWAFPHPTARRASFYDSERGLRVSVEYDDSYQFLVFWTLIDQPFICVEPWSSGRLAFPGGPEVHRLEPGQSLSSHVTIRAVDSDH